MTEVTGGRLGRGLRLPSCDFAVVFTVSEGASRNWGGAGQGRTWGSLWGWRDLGYLQGKREMPPGGGAGAVCLRAEAQAEAPPEIRWGLGDLRRRVLWKLL